jgi:hypothetical protein
MFQNNGLQAKGTSGARLQLFATTPFGVHGILHAVRMRGSVHAAECFVFFFPHGCIACYKAQAVL